MGIRIWLDVELKWGSERANITGECDGNRLLPPMRLPLGMGGWRRRRDRPHPVVYLRMGGCPEVDATPATPIAEESRSIHDPPPEAIEAEPVANHDAAPVIDFQDIPPTEIAEEVASGVHMCMRPLSMKYRLRTSPCLHIVIYG